MRKSALAFLIAAAVVAIVPVGVGRAQSPVKRRDAAAVTLAEALRAAAKPPYLDVTFESAAAYDELVKVNYAIADSALFARVKSASADQLRQIRAREYCDGDRIAYLRQGVVVNEIFATSDHSDWVSVSIAYVACNEAKSTPARYGCTAPLAHFSQCPPDDRRCEVASKMRGCVSDELLFMKRNPFQPRK